MRTLLHTPANNLENSLSFYSRLDFTIVSDENPVIVSDGTLCIEINTDRYARTGIKLFSPSWGEATQTLKEITAVIKIDDGYLLSDTSGTWIYLIERSDEPVLDIPDTNSALGNCVGISLETPGIEQSAKIWTTLGFSQDTSDWPAFTNEDGVTITLYEPNSCPHLFFNPSLTYFNGGNNERIIENIRKQQIPITEEITYFNEQGIVDNVVLRDPAGLGFLVFND